MLSCRASLPLSHQTLNFAAGIIRRHRISIGSLWRKLNPGQQALLVLVYLRKGETFASVAAGFGIGTATAWRYVEETVGLLAAPPALAARTTCHPGAGPATAGPVATRTLAAANRHTIASRRADQPADGCGGPIMTAPEVAAQRLAGTTLAPAGSQLVLAEWTAQGSTGDEPLYQAPLHQHPEDEAWYVLEGMLAVRVGEHVHQISAGGAVIVPGDTAHTFWNPRPDPARYLLIMGARTFALIQAIHQTDDRSPARMRQLYAAHGATLLG